MTVGHGDPGAVGQGVEIVVRTVCKQRGGQVGVGVTTGVSVGGLTGTHFPAFAPAARKANLLAVRNLKSDNQIITYRIVVEVSFILMVECGFGKLGLVAVRGQFVEEMLPVLIALSTV